MAQLQKQRIPRNLYYSNVANAIIGGSGIQDILGVLNRDAVEFWFDDFQGATLDDLYTLKESTGATTVGASTAILASGVAADNDYAGFTGGGLLWTGGQNCLFQTRLKISAAALTETKYEFGWHGAVAGSAGLFNDIDAPTWVGTTAGVLFGYDADSATDLVWQAGAYSSAAPKKRVLYDSGTATANTPTVLTQSAHTWVANSFVGQEVWSAGSHATVISNTTKALTHGRWNNGTPAATADYIISNVTHATAADTPTIPHLDRYNTYSIKLEGVVAKYYIDGVQVAEIPAAVAATTTALTPWFFAQARGDGSENAILTVDYLLCMQSRRT
jgi:hypothetical protein